MAQSRADLLLQLLLLVVLAIAEATPPGIANNPSHARCLIKKYKHCYNLEHVCPKFCPDSCTVECVSCKPICGASSPQSPPAYNYSSPPPPTTPAPSPPTTWPPIIYPPTTPTSPPSPTTPAPSAPPTTLSPAPPTTTPSPPTPPTASPSPPTSYSPPPMKTAKCKNKNYPACYNIKHACPSSCPGACEVDCVTCKPVCNCDQPGAVCQDPRFIGGDGLTFYFHGKKNSDFCLVSDSNIHINAHFIGKRNQNMKRDFTWVQSIGILFDNHRLYIGAQKTATWDDSVDRLALIFDGEPISLPESIASTWQSNSMPRVSIIRTLDTNSVQVEVEGNFKITAKVVPITNQESRIHNYNITREDCFSHLDLGFKFLSLSSKVNGVLGQTYREDYVSQMKMGIAMPVMGGEREFASSSLFAVDCSVARFVGSSVDGAHSGLEDMELPGLKCASGIEGRGVVCKR